MEQSEENRRESFPLLSICFILLIVLCVMIVGGVLLNDYFEGVRAESASAHAEYVEHNQTVSSFPHRMTISSKTAYLDGIHLLEMYGNHSYTGYVIVSIDRGSLTDDDIYWITKGYRFEWELNANTYWWPDGTDGDIATVDYFAFRQTATHVYFIFRTDPQRYSLKDKHFSIAVTYLPEGASISEQYRYSYAVDFSGQHYHDSTDFLPNDALIALADAMVDAVS